MTADIAKNQAPNPACEPVIAVVKPNGDHPGGWLHQSLLGEYLAMLLMAHAVMTAVAWVCYVDIVLLELIIGFACGWVVIRCAGGFSGRRYVSAVTIVVLGLTWATRFAEWGAVPGWLVSGPFSQAVLQAILAAILVIDLLELWQSRHLRGDHFHKSAGAWSQQDD